MTGFVAIEARVLKKALEPITAVIERRNTIPILGTVLIELDDLGLHLSGSDLDITATTTLDVIDGDGRWATCVDAQRLMRICCAAGSEDLRIEPSKMDTAIIWLGDKSSYQVNTSPASDFPKPQARRGNLIESFTNGLLASTLGKVDWCISTEESRYYLNGVCWQAHSSGLRFVATDGHRLACCRYGPTEGSNRPDRIIPRKTVGLIIRFMAGADVKVFDTSIDHIIECAAPNLRIRSGLIDNNYPDVDRVIPEQYAHALRFVREDLIRSVDQAAAILGKGDGRNGRAVKFEQKGSKVSLSCASADFGASSIDTAAEWPSGEDPFALNYRYIREIAQKCQGEIRLGMNDPASPFLVEDRDETMTRVIMPMRA